MSDIYIHGIGLAGYRSFGEEIQYIGPFNKINLFIGKNNSGKSNVLKFLSEYYSKIISNLSDKSVKLEFTDLHIPKSVQLKQILVSIMFKSASELIENINKNKIINETINDILLTVINSDIYLDKNGFYWLPLGSNIQSNLNFNIKKYDTNVIYNKKLLNDEGWSILWRTLTDRSLGNIKEHWIPESLDFINSHINLNSPKIVLIDAIREIKKTENNSGTIIEEHYNGLGIIDRLADLQRPEYAEQEKKNKFHKINAFLKSVTGDPTAELEIPNSHRTINVNLDNKLLPIEALGTGIHELIILASAATILENQVICIEEPEIHLHPSLQKKFLHYLADKTNNQYFITTHSAHLLDCPNVSIFHISLVEGLSKVVHVETDFGKSLICTDLGYRASDILQTNCIIWVEGPSDRIYLNYWIRTLDDSLIEGTHYSIMFYGGRLLSHLKADDEEINEFISLRKLNRNMCILIDSDKQNENSSINPTKKRILNEFKDDEGFAWISKGREVENYIPPDIVEKALLSVHKNAKKLNCIGQFDNCLNSYVLKNGNLIDGSADKVKIARAVVILQPTLDVLDLHTMVTKLLAYVYKCNEI